MSANRHWRADRRAVRHLSRSSILRSVGARLLAAIAAVLATGGAIARISHPSTLTAWLGHTAAIAAVLSTSVVFAPGGITHDRIEGAAMLYLNIAVAFTSAFRMIHELNPGALATCRPITLKRRLPAQCCISILTTLMLTGLVKFCR